MIRNTLDFFLTAGRDAKRTKPFSVNVKAALAKAAESLLWTKCRLSRSYRWSPKEGVAEKWNYRQINNIVGRDHQGIKRLVNPGNWGFGSFNTARQTIKDAGKLWTWSGKDKFREWKGANQRQVHQPNLWSSCMNSVPHLQVSPSPLQPSFCQHNRQEKWKGSFPFCIAAQIPPCFFEPMNVSNSSGSPTWEWALAPCIRQFSPACQPKQITWVYTYDSFKYWKPYHYVLSMWLYRWWTNRIVYLPCSCCHPTSSVPQDYLCLHVIKSCLACFCEQSAVPNCC